MSGSVLSCELCGKNYRRTENHICLEYPDKESDPKPEED